jgi:hypothetical protein
MNNFRLFKIDELRQMKPGTLFEHKTLGLCILKKDRRCGLKYMVFKGKTKDAYFIKDDEPWNEPMRMITDVR